ncbi:MAG TPA: Spx/MgsR family RNA polymerase-binding regulatory protein [Opitutaceae bacterium]|nr:Spx/MgsR family RNA polymerase-binding regulatory protein [Opitutaceae bacterium]
MPLKIYTLSTCDTCRRALQWLRQHEVAVDEQPIREHPPTTAELRAMLAAQAGVVRRLFNTSGRDYRALGIGERLDSMPVEEAIKLLSTNGNLVKRPFLIGPGVALVGFDEVAWRAALSDS